MQVRDAEHVERQRANVLAMEDRVVRAFGSAEDIARLDDPTTDTPETEGVGRR